MTWYGPRVMSASTDEETRKVGPAAGNRGKGRKKGVPNKTTKAVKEMILAALDGVGGVDYLMRQAEENPGPFMTLVGKVLPLDVNANVAAQIGMPVINIAAPPDAG